MCESHRSTFWQVTEGDCPASNVGAVAQLYDISCLGKAQFDSIQTDAFASWSACPDTDPLGTGLTQAMQAEFNVTQTGLHYFVKQGGNNVPVWDLTGSGPFKGNKDAIVFANKTKSVPSPDGASNVAWLELVKVSGGLATKIYRLNTVSGQPASSVSSGVDWCLSFSINVIFFIVQARRIIKCQVYLKIRYVCMAL